VDGGGSWYQRSSVRNNSFASTYASLDGVNLDICTLFFKDVALTVSNEARFSFYFCLVRSYSRSEQLGSRQRAICSSSSGRRQRTCFQRAARAKGNLLLPGGLLCMRGYLGSADFLADCARACHRQASGKYSGVDDSVCSGFGFTYGDWWRGSKSWSCCGGREHCTSSM
jgi:hypothetical protein